MARVVKSSVDLSHTVNLIQFGREVADGLDKLHEQVSEECLKEVRSNSEQFTKYGHGDYAKGWTKTRTADGYVVHNTNYRLPHLLENDHPIFARGKKVADYKGRKHIAPAADNANKKFVERAEQIIEEKARKI